jgi:PAS domain-containing protein
MLAAVVALLCPCLPNWKRKSSLRTFIRSIHVSVSVSPIKDAEGHVIGASKVIHDTTELAARGEALAREKEFLATTIASIGDAVIATDAEGRLALMNRAAELLTGWHAG